MLPRGEICAPSSVRARTRPFQHPRSNDLNPSSRDCFSNRSFCSGDLRVRTGLLLEVGTHCATTTKHDPPSTKRRPAAFDAPPRFLWACLRASWLRVASRGIREADRVARSPGGVERPRHVPQVARQVAAVGIRACARSSTSPRTGCRRGTRRSGRNRERPRSRKGSCPFVRPCGRFRSGSAGGPVCFSSGVNTEARGGAGGSFLRRRKGAWR